MIEDRWQRTDELTTTREHLLMTLADLDTILIKLSYSMLMESSSLLSVEMQYATIDGGGVAALEVESCTCPHGYAGTSCEVKIILFRVGIELASTSMITIDIFSNVHLDLCAAVVVSISAYV
jgi:hypothetical protein